MGLSKTDPETKMWGWVVYFGWDFQKNRVRSGKGVREERKVSKGCSQLGSYCGQLREVVNSHCSVFEGLCETPLWVVLQSQRHWGIFFPGPSLIEGHSEVLALWHFQLPAVVREYLSQREEAISIHRNYLEWTSRAGQEDKDGAPDSSSTHTLCSLSKSYLCLSDWVREPSHWTHNTNILATHYTQFSCFTSWPSGHCNVDIQKQGLLHVFILHI